MENLIPENQFALVCLRLCSNVFHKFLVEIELKVAVVGRTDAVKLGFASVILFPFCCGAFVTSEMQVSVGEQGNELIDHILGKLHCRGIGNIHNVGAYSLHNPDFVWIFGVACENFRICGNSSLSMSRYVDFRYHFNETVFGVSDNFLDIFLGIVAGVRDSVRSVCTPAERSASSGCANFGQLRIFLDFDSPALVFGEVPVEAVHFIKRHHVNDSLYLVFAENVTSFIKHESAPSEAGSIFNCHFSQGRGL